MKKHIYIRRRSRLYYIKDLKIRPLCAEVTRRNGPIIFVPKKKLLQISGNGFRFFDDQYFVDRRSMDMLSLTGNDNYKTSTPKIMTTSFPLHNLICK